MKSLYLAIGINEFMHLPQATLKGCVNDAKDMAVFFKERFGDSRGTVLLNDYASKLSIEAVMRRMAQNCVDDPGIEVVNISVSSHGCQVPDVDGDEDDGIDEAVVVADTQITDEIVRETVITDDEWKYMLLMFPRTIVVNVFLDTCFSGDGIRLVGGNFSSRYLPNPIGLPMKKRILSNRWVIPAGKFKLLSHGLEENVCLLSGCDETETSADAEIDGRYNGAMTRAFLECTEIRLCRNQTAAAMRRWLRKNDFEQHPQLEGSRVLLREPYYDEVS